MQKTKKWYESKTIWASIVTTGIGLLKLIESNFGINLIGSEIINVILGLAGLLGIYGRKTAKKEIE